MTVTEFLLARIAEDEELLEREGRVYGGDGEVWTTTAHARALAEHAAKRAIVQLHRDWPVLVEQPPTIEKVESDALDRITFRASQRFVWLTEQEYRTKFGDEPPTAPMLAALAAVYADHPDYRQEWKP